MELLFICVAALWLYLKPRRGSAPADTTNPDDAGSRSVAAYSPYVEGQPYSNPDATSYPSVDGSVTGTDWNAIQAYDDYLLYGIEAPIAPARPSARG